MSILPSIAGPSRIPLLVLSHRTLPLIRGYATTSASADETPLPFPLDQDITPAPREEEMDRDARAAALKDKRLWASGVGYHRWRRGAGAQFATSRKGDRANWLGGSVPYPANPSFRPPPPLSNDIQEALYKELKAGKKMIGVLANEYSVSKARIDAVRKLKEVEAEMHRQSLPLQEAFRDGMEPLLAVHSSTDPRTKQYSERIQREGAQLRGAHPSTTVEREEELRFEAGLGAGGAFGDRNRYGKKEGVEKPAWEWRDEDTVIEGAETAGDTKNAVKAMGARGEGAEMVEAEEAFPTPLTRQIHREVEDALERVTRKAGQGTSIPTGTLGQTKSAYRFIDTSSRTVHLPKDMIQADHARVRAKERKAKRRAARV